MIYDSQIPEIGTVTAMQEQAYKQRLTTQRSTIAAKISEAIRKLEKDFSLPDHLKPLLPEVVAELKSKGYAVVFESFNAVKIRLPLPVQP